MIHKGMFSLAVLERHGTCCRQAIMVENGYT